MIASVEELMAQLHLKAAIARVTIDGEEFVTVARGDSMNGVPATPEMHFRNGAIAITYIATALLILVDQGEESLEIPWRTGCRSSPRPIQRRCACWPT